MVGLFVFLKENDGSIRCHTQLKKNASLSISRGFECCTCSCAAGLIAVWFPEPTRVTGSRGRCDPGWQMEHTLPCKGSLKVEGGQRRSAHQSQPHTAHFWLRGFPQGVPKKAGGWRLQGAYPMSLSLLHGLMVSFPRERSPPCPPQVGWQHLGVSCCALCGSPRPRRDPWFWPSASAAGGSRVTKKGTASFTGFVSTQRQPAYRKERAFLRAALKDAVLSTKIMLDIGSFARERAPSPSEWFPSGRLMSASPRGAASATNIARLLEHKATGMKVNLEWKGSVAGWTS